MRNLKLLLACVLLSACTGAPESAPQATGHSPAPAPATAKSSSVAASPGTSTSSASATGVVEAIDSSRGRITIAHGPVASLQWPAMTMTFQTGAVDVRAIEPGDHVSFEFTATGMHATLTAIAKQPRPDGAAH